jgi:phosphatidylglycerophosphate synthase
MDAIDGRQARRTNSSSPLGQLFDHGCDCIVSGFFGLFTCHVCLIGWSWAAVLAVIVTHLMFFSAQWYERHTGVCPTNIGGLFGVTEAELLVALTQLAGFLFPGFGRTVLVGGWTITSVYLVLYTVGCSVGFFLTISDGMSKSPANSRAALDLLPSASLNLGVLIWSLRSGNPDVISILIFILNILNPHLTIRIILSTITGLPYSPYQVVLIPLVICGLMDGLGWLQRPQIFLSFLFGNFFFYFNFNLIKMILEIKNFLGISVFTLKSPRIDKK